MPSKGLIHVYYGSGKGKTTAALGLAVRASGRGKNVVLIQFLKDSNTGEIEPLTKLDITILRGKAPGALFAKDFDEQAFKETLKIHNDNLSKSIKLARTGMCDLLILDEVLDAYQLNLLDEALFTELVKNKPSQLELVITGHKSTPWVIDCADYVTEMVKEKHPYDAGVQGRRGIEF